MNTQFKTTAAYLSGGICGPIWQPGFFCGKPLQASILPKGSWDKSTTWTKGGTFREWLLSVITREGGDFQSATFTADTVIRIERRAVDGPGKYRVHTKELAIADLCDCKDLVNEDAYTGDFMGEDE